MDSRMQERNDGGQWGHNSPGTESLWGRRMTARASKCPTNVTSTFFNTLHWVPKDLRFEHGCAKPASCPGRHLTSLRPCSYAESESIETTFRSSPIEAQTKVIRVSVVASIVSSYQESPVLSAQSLFVCKLQSKSHVICSDIIYNSQEQLQKVNWDKPGHLNFLLEPGHSLKEKLRFVRGIWEPSPHTSNVHSYTVSLHQNQVRDFVESTNVFNNLDTVTSQPGAHHLPRSVPFFAGSIK